MLARSSLAYTGSIVVLVGGILLVIVNGLLILGFLVTIPFRSTLQGTALGGEFVGLAIGIIALVCHRLVKRLEWGIIIIVIGFLAAGLPGVLILVGGILGLVSRFMQPHNRS